MYFHHEIEDSQGTLHQNVQHVEVLSPAGFVQEREEDEAEDTQQCDLRLNIVHHEIEDPQSSLHQRSQQVKHLVETGSDRDRKGEDDESGKEQEEITENDQECNRNDRGVYSTAQALGREAEEEGAVCEDLNSDIEDGSGDEEEGAVCEDLNSDIENSNEASELEEECTGNDETSAYSLTDSNLDTTVNLSDGICARDIFLMTLGLSVRHNWTYENIIDHFTCQNAVLELPCLPKSKNMLWSVLRNEASNELEYHVYCNSCLAYVGLKSRKLKFPIKCPNNMCSYTIIEKKVKYFVILDLKKQLQRFLSIPGISNVLQYCSRREKRNPTSIQDVYDGEVYKRLVRENVITVGKDLTYFFNTDGVKVMKASKISAWPLYIRINELPPNLRQKFLFLAGLWVDNVGPNMNAFLKPFAAKADDLSTNGILWKPDGHTTTCSKIFPLGAISDSKARYLLYNMSQFNSYHGCTVCDIIGVWSNRNMRYPVLPPNDAVFQYRTDNSLKADMCAADECGKSVNGVKGPSLLMNMKFHSMTDGQAMDDLHTLYEGCAKHHTDLLMKLKCETNIVVRESIINTRMKCIKTPSGISRKPGDITKRGTWKGSEWRNFLLFYGCVCLKGLVPEKYIEHFALLSHAAFLMSQDEISCQDLITIDRTLVHYVKQFEKLFGIDEMYYNIHLLLHFKRCISNLGPTWSYSTFNFESWNRKCISEQAHSPQGIALQIVHRYLIKQLVNTCMYTDIKVSPEVRQKLQELLTKKKRHVSHTLGDVYFLGRATKRKASQEERVVLQREGYDAIDFTEYSSILYRSELYEADYAKSSSPELLSKNSEVYTWDDTFCKIERFVTLVHEECEISGVFFREYDVEPLSFAKHIVKILPTADLHFNKVQNIRSPVVCLKLGLNNYRVPLPNCYEID